MKGYFRIKAEARVILIPLVVGLSACDKITSIGIPFLDRVNEVVVAPDEVMLESGSNDFRLQKAAKVVGGMSSICLGLSSPYPPGPSKEMKADFTKLMGGATVTSTAFTRDGDSYAFGEPMRAWAREGVVSGQSELSGCMHPIKPLPENTEFNRIEIHSSLPLKATGIYWESMDTFDGIN